MVSLRVDIKKKDLWLLSSIVVFLIGVGFVVAYDAGFAGGNPAVMGHSSDEVNVKNSSGDVVSLQEFIEQGGLDCYIKGTIASNPTLCCDSGYVAVGMNVAELEFQAYWDDVRCVDFQAAASTKLKQIMCCKI